jgi:molybdopterin/thiamine biosynthesis adenylyltransferase
LKKMSDRPFDYQDYRNRYAQHIMFYEAGVHNREKVFSARVAVIGLGGIALETTRLLTVAGVRLLRFIHWEAEPAGISGDSAYAPAEEAELLPRGIAAVETLVAANPSGAEVVNAADVADFQDLLRDVDLILYEDTDGDRQRCHLVEESARRLRKPWLYAEAHGGLGMTVLVIPGRTACIGCVKEKIKRDDGQLRYAATVTDLIARTISQVQAMEALKQLGESPSLSAEAYCFDVESFGRVLSVPKNDSCPMCNS